MVRVRCPVCQTTFGVTAPHPACPTCGFAGRSSPAAAAPAEGWMPAEPAAAGPASWVPATGPESAQPLIVPLHAPEVQPPGAPPPRRKRRTGLVVTLIVVGLLVLAGAAAAYLYLAPGSPLKKQTRAGAVTEQELRTAVSEFEALTAGTESSTAFGLEGSFTQTAGAGGFSGSFQVRLLWDAPAQGYAFRVALEADAGSIAIEKKQKGKVINYVTPSGVSVGRDEDPTTRPGLRDAPQDPQEALDLGGFTVASKEASSVNGRPATLFRGQQGAAELQVWVYDDTKLVAKVKFSETGKGAFELVVLYGTEVRIEVDPDAPKRASFDLESTSGLEDSTYSGWTYLNGTVSADHVEEVKLDEVEIRFTGANQATVKMKLSEKTKQVGNYTVRYTDADDDGLVSSGDTYQIRKRTNESLTNVEFFDLWADAEEGGPKDLPGFGGAVALAAACLALGFGLRRRRFR